MERKCILIATKTYPLIGSNGVHSQTTHIEYIPSITKNQSWKKTNNTFQCKASFKNRHWSPAPVAVVAHCHGCMLPATSGAVIFGYSGNRCDIITQARGRSQHCETSSAAKAKEPAHCHQLHQWPDIGLREVVLLAKQMLLKHGVL